MWLRVLRLLPKAFLIAVGIAASFIFYPILYIVWGIYNRKNISLWLSMSLALMSVMISYLYYKILSTYTPINWLDPLTNPFILFGAFLTLPFLITRSPIKRSLSSKQRYYLAIVLFILQLILLLSPVVLIHHLLQKHYSPIHLLLTTETTILMWISLVTYLFIKYPEDILVRDFYQHISNFQNKIRDNKPDKK